MSLVRPLRQLQFPIRVSVLCSQACNADLAAIGEPHLRWNALPARSRQRIDEVERMVGTRNFFSSPRSAALAGVLAAPARSASRQNRLGGFALRGAEGLLRIV
jgi:hypothetical protein